MKIDYDFLKQILIVMVDNDSYEIDTEKLMEKLEIDEDNKQKIDSFLGHLCILNDNNCLDCRDDDLGIISRGSDGECCYTVEYFRLTAQGYQFLDVLKNDTIFSKIKDFSVSTAIEVGKAALINWVVK